MIVLKQSKYIKKNFHVWNVQLLWAILCDFILCRSFSMVRTLRLYLGIGCVPLNRKELVSSLAGIWEAYGLMQMCACVMLLFLRVQTTACGSWLTLCLSNFCSMFSNLEEAEMKLLLTSLLDLWRTYYNDLMVCMVPTGVIKILTCMMCWDLKFFLPHFQ